MNERFGFSRRSKRLAVVVAGLLVLSVVGVALAAIVSIDTFNSGILNLGVNSLTPTNQSAIDTDASALGGEREGDLTWLSGAGTASLKVNDFGTQRLNFNQDNGVSARGIIRWDGVDAQPTVNNQGLTENLLDGTNDGFHIEVINDDIPIPLILRVYSGAGNYSTYSLNLPGGILSPGVHVDFFIPFGPGNGWVATGAGATFSAVTSIEVEFDGTTSAGADVSIDLFEADADREYGDLPTSGGDETTGPADYADSVLQANHMPQGLRLGRSVDVEETTQPDVPAGTTTTGDDNSLAGPNPFDDEDGVVQSPGILWNETDGGSIDYTISGCPVARCRLSGWIDWNNDGDFADTGEQIMNDVQVLNGSNFATFAIPAGSGIAGGSNSTYYARFRVCTTAGVCNNVTAQDVPNGEVEDYRWGFGPTAVTLNNLEAKADTQNNTAALVLAATVVAALGLAGAALRRRTA